MNNKISIPYGSKNIEFSLPTNMRLGAYAQPSIDTGIDDSEVDSHVREALDNLMGLKPLNSLISSTDSIAIVVDDISRPTPTYLLIPPLITYLTEEIGTSKENITFIFGLGVHRQMTQEEAELKLTKEIANKYRWENHDCYENLVHLGKTSKGTPITVNATYYKADFKICIGLIEPHLWAGFSGGSKGIMPGICGVDSIVKHHSLVRKKAVTVGKLEGNPFRSDLEEIVDNTGLDLILNVILTPEKQIYQIVAGDRKVAFAHGVAICRQITGIPVDEKSDIIISSPAPLGIDFRQSSKAAFNTQDALKPGGVMIVVSECPEGKGNIKSADKTPKRGLIKLLAKILPAKLLMQVIKKQGYGVEDGAGTFRMFKFIAKYHYIFVSDIPAEDRNALFVADHATDVDQALKMAQAMLMKENYLVNVFPLGGSTFPIMNG